MRTVALTILASVAVSLSITVSCLWFLAPISLGVFFYILLYRIESTRMSILTGSIFGLSTGGAGIWWFWHALPVDWIAPTSVVTQWAAVFITWLLVTLALALPTVIFAYVIWRLRNNKFISVFLILGWTLQEFGRELSFAILTVAPESIISPHFSSANIGYTLANNNYLLQLAEGGGVYFLSTVVALMATIIAFAMYNVRNKNNLILSFVLILVLLAPLMQSNEVLSSGTTNTFAILSSDIPRSSGIDPSLLYRKALEDIADNEVVPDVILIPEGNGIVKMTDDSKSFLQGLFGENEVLVISSAYIENDNGNKYSKLSYDSSTKGNIENYEKIFLMPQGEYTPRIISLTFPILRNDYVDRYIKNLDLEKGTGVKSVEYNGLKIGGLLCSESISPHLYKKMVKEQGANVLVNLARTSWFHDSRLLHRKTIELGKVHAVQNRSYYLQASNGSPSFVINPKGELVSETIWNEAMVINVEI